MLKINTINIACSLYCYTFNANMNLWYCTLFYIYNLHVSKISYCVLFYRSLCESVLALPGKESIQMEEQCEKEHSCCNLQWAVSVQYWEQGHKRCQTWGCHNGLWQIQSKWLNWHSAVGSKCWSPIRIQSLDRCGCNTRAGNQSVAFHQTKHTGFEEENQTPEI